MDDARGRRALLGVFASAGVVALGGCAGAIPQRPALRVRNDTDAEQTVRVTVEEQETLIFEREFVVAANDYPGETVQDVYPGAGYYAVTARTDAVETTERLNVGGDGEMTGVTVRDDGIDIGEITP